MKVVLGLSLYIFTTVLFASSANLQTANISCGPSGYGHDDKICAIETSPVHACYITSMMAVKASVDELVAIASKACSRNIHESEIRNIQVSSARTTCDIAKARATVLCYRKR